MRWNLHGLIVEGTSPDPDVADRWQRAFASCPASEAAPDMTCYLELTSAPPAPPAAAPQFRQGDLLEYYVTGDDVVAHFPRFGQLWLDLARGVTRGQVARAALDTYGVFEDLLAIALSPHLRRRGLFLIHAFAASLPTPTDQPRAVLIVGDIGAGKTTTGLALLNAGWRLLSNDSPILRAPAEVLSYPGLLAAYPDTLRRFAATAPFAAARPDLVGRQKISVAAEQVWPEVWQAHATVGAIVFPHIEPRAEHALELLRAPEATRLLLPHAIEQWDKAMIPAHLRLLSQLAQTVPAYRLRLSPAVMALPELLAGLLAL